MRVSIPPIYVVSRILVDDDMNFNDLYQVKNLAAPAAKEALRKGVKDVVNADIADAANIAATKILNVAMTRTLFQAEGDLLIRGATVPQRLAKITTGQYLRATATGYEGATVILPVLVRKTADQIVINSVALVSDTHLSFPIGANEVWEVEYLLLLDTVPMALFQYAISAPGGSSGRRFNINRSEVADDPFMVYNDLGSPAEIKEPLVFVVIKAVVINGATPGNVVLQWAPSLVRDYDTTLKTNSCLIAHRLV
ncbi:hypothetical protein ES708_25444 [subsurface metagenome]